MPIKVLWFETEDLYAVRRGKEAGKQLGVEVHSLDAFDLSLLAEAGCSGVFAGGHDLVRGYDAIIVRTFMPFVSEVLTIARLFRAAGKVVVDSSLTDEGYAMSKMHDYMLLAAEGVQVPRTRQLFDPNEAATFAAEIGFPCVLKGVHGSEGRHVHKVESPEQLWRQLRQYRTGEVMVQEFLPAEQDYRVMLVGYRALPVYVSRKPRAGDFRTNFEFNEEVTPLPTSEAPHLRDIAERAARTLRREFTGVDIRCRGATPLVLEANRRPGFKGFEEKTGYDVAGAFIGYVKRRCEGTALP
jgi:RimK family alpha-L-glutamate ligase